jgi:hypothetical protein
MQNARRVEREASVAVASTTALLAGWNVAAPAGARINFEPVFER